ncbi:MAG TPA: hypothetical protein VHV32_02080 [Candidatus Angelobacter sp.]|nr:hypothetical protein [Candidatus Angelobacter sp.]
MKIFTKMILVLALASSLAAQQPAKDTSDQPAKDQSSKVLAGAEGVTGNFFKLAFVMYELEDGKRTNQRDYMMIGRTDNQPSSIKVATKVPITTYEKAGDKGYTYTDVGLRINCSMKEQVDRRLQLHCDIEISSIIPREQIANATGNAIPAAPFLRSTRNESWALLTLGKPAILTTVDDINSTKRMQIEVTGTKVD